MALEVIEAVREELPQLVLRVIDISEAPEVAVRYGILAIPAIAINRTLVFHGVPPAHVLRDRILQTAR